jgi:hypothetical protein
MSLRYAIPEHFHMHTSLSSIVGLFRAIGLQILSTTPTPESLSWYSSQLLGFFIQRFGELHADMASFVNDIRPSHSV